MVNVAGCPTHPGWVVETLERAGAEGWLAGDDLDALGRPRFYADQPGAPRLHAQRVLRVQGQRRASRRTWAA
ncbi:MAG: hypothetical protein MZW92_57610 [Comamonadaceae bacterium]|nr:hypothetical protein [Comamonadaceae bacterium]